MKYVPSIKVPSDDLVLVDDEGNEHRPHEGEWVQFRRSLPLVALRLIWERPDLEGLEPVEAFQANIERSEAVVQALAHQIVDWNWTDDFDKPLPSPANGKEAFTETLRWLSPKERVWLEEHVMDGALPSKNSESP